MEWADATVWKATPLSGQPDTRLRELLVHIHVVQRAFFSAWTSRPVTDAFKRAEEFETLGAVRSWAQPCTKRWRLLFKVSLKRALWRR